MAVWTASIDSRMDSSHSIVVVFAIHDTCKRLGVFYSTSPWSYWQLAAARWEKIDHQDALPSQTWGGRVKNQYTENVFLPYWLLVALSGVAASAPWLSWRFSLRTMLVGITILAMMLGLLVYAFE